MKHGVKKVKFKKGQDSNEAIMRKLTLNFLRHGRIETTLHKAKALKSLVDRLTYKSRMNRESDRNILLKHLEKRESVKYMLEVVGPTFKSRTGGFVTVAKLGPRQGDNAEMAIVEWVKPIEALVGSKKTVKADAPDADKKKASGKSDEAVKETKKETKKEPATETKSTSKQKKTS